MAVTNNSLFGNSVEAFINFTYQPGGSVASFFTDGAIEQNHTEKFAADYAFDASFTNLGLSARVFGQSRISFMQKPPTGVVKSYVTDKYSAKQNVPHTAVIPATAEGGRLDRIDVVEATGTVDAVLYVGTKTAYNELIDGANENRIFGGKIEQVRVGIMLDSVSNPQIHGTSVKNHLSFEQTIDFPLLSAHATHDEFVKRSRNEKLPNTSRRCDFVGTS